MEERECYSCGFLAKYCPESSIPTPRYFEVEQKERTDGNLFQHALEVGHVPRRSYPTCYRQVPEVLQEFLPYTDLVHKDQTHVVQIINRKRICSEWCEYIPGFSPKERFEQVK